MSPDCSSLENVERLSDFDFDLPDEFIAQRPASRPEDSRLLLIRRNPSKGLPRFEDLLTSDLPEIAQSEALIEDVLWLRNTSRVFRARFYATRESGGEHEIVLLQPQQRDGFWSAIVRRQSRLKYPQVLSVVGRENFKVIVHDGPLVEFPDCTNEDVFALLDEVGQMPLPPYIFQKNSEEDALRYQPVWADKGQTGSAAAPTASLHFSDDLLGRMKKAGVHFSDLVLHVGLGTFEPLRNEEIAQNVLHQETFFVSKQSMEQIVRAKKRLCIGTTALRTLESVLSFEKHGDLVLKKVDEAGNLFGSTKIFLKSGYDFNESSFLLTNFHLPKSSLFILVSAFAGSKSLALDAYKHAINKRYRFFSYGDATLWV